MALQLCYGCLHPFPAQSLTPVTSFGRELAARMETLRAVVAKITPNNAHTRECVASIEDELKRLTLAVDKELTEKNETIEKLQVQVRFYATREEEQRKRERLLEQQRSAVKPPPRPNPNAGGGPLYASKLLQRFLATSNALPTPLRHPSEGSFTVMNRFGEAVSARSGPRSSPRRGDGGDSIIADDSSARRIANKLVPPNPLDLVSATLYNTLQYVAGRTQAALGIVWIRCEENDEMIAPFLVGADVKPSRYGVPPPHIRVASTVAGTVLLTGIAVNVLRTGEPAVAAESETLQVALENTSRSTLLVPIFKKYAETERQCFGVLQLVGWARSTPFSTTDEATATYAAQAMSHIVSMYHASMIGDWTSRTFDPQPMLKVARYIAELDNVKGGGLGPDFGGLGDCISASHPPFLIFRSNAHAAAHDDAGSGASASAFRFSKDVVSGGPLHEVLSRDELKDVHRYATALEESWKKSVTSQADLQRRCDLLQEQLDRARHSLNEARRTGLAATVHDEHATQQSFKTIAAIARDSVREAAAASSTGRHSVKNRSLPSFSLAEIDDLEVETQARLESAAEDVKASQQRKRTLAEQREKKKEVAPPQTAPASSSHGRQTFLTQAQH